MFTFLFAFHLSLFSNSDSAHSLFVHLIPKLAISCKGCNCLIAIPYLEVLPVHGSLVCQFMNEDILPSLAIRCQTWQQKISFLTSLV